MQSTQTSGEEAGEQIANEGVEIEGVEGVEVVEGVEGDTIFNEGDRSDE